MLLLEPNLYSKRIVDRCESKIATFYFYSSITYAQVELWTNLSINEDWHALIFRKQHDNHYKVTVNISGLVSKQYYEFTARYKENNDDDWSWLGFPGQNGSIYLIDSSLSNKINPPNFGAVPQLRFIFKQHLAQVHLWHFKTQYQHSSKPSISSFPLGSLPHSIHGFTAIIRKESTWLTPVSGHNNFNEHVNSKEKWQLFLYQDKEQGNIHLWLAINNTADCWFSPDYNSSVNFFHSSQQEAHIIIVSSQPQQSAHSLLKVALDYYQQLGLPKNHSIKRNLPINLLDKLGYCTWNAFGQDLNMKDLMNGLEKLKENNIPINYLLLDDGWQSISSQYQLNGFDTIRQKFSEGLKQSITAVKSNFPSIQHIGVWHALWGYWKGVDQEFAKKNQYGWDNYLSERGDAIGIVKKPEVFYCEFYHYLRQQGVDFIKVDNQGGVQDLLLPEDEKMELLNRHRSSLIKYGDKFFNGYVIHCMSLTPPILFHFIFSSIQNSLFRSSDDFFPDEDRSHSWHIFANIINSLLTSYYPIVSDWDMFQSDHPFAEYHAASRAISGGPVYISDSPGRHDPKLIHRLLGETRNNEYTLLRSLQPPQPTFHTVFNNPIGTNSLISMYNDNRELELETDHSCSASAEYSVCAFFNVSVDPKLAVVSNGLLYPKKYLSWVVAYVVSGLDQGKLKLFKPKTDDMVLRVDGMSSSIVSISPVVSLGLLSIACLGLIDKFNGTRAIIKTKQIIEREEGYYYYHCDLSHRSECCGFWLSTINSERAVFHPCIVLLDHQELILNKDWSWNRSTGLLTVNMLSVPLNISTLANFSIEIYTRKITLAN